MGFNRYDILRGVEPKKSLCGYCQKMMPEVEKRRLCTAYANEEFNWMESCLDCYIEQNEYYKERWDDYYAGAL